MAMNAVEFIGERMVHITQKLGDWIMGFYDMRTAVEQTLVVKNYVILMEAVQGQLGNAPGSEVTQTESDVSEAVEVTQAETNISVEVGQPNVVADEIVFSGLEDDQLVEIVEDIPLESNVSLETEWTQEEITTTVDICVVSVHGEDTYDVANLIEPVVYQPHVTFNDVLIDEIVLVHEENVVAEEGRVLSEGGLSFEALREESFVEEACDVQDIHQYFLLEDDGNYLFPATFEEETLREMEEGVDVSLETNCMQEENIVAVEIYEAAVSGHGEETNDVADLVVPRLQQAHVTLINFKPYEIAAVQNKNADAEEESSVLEGEPSSEDLREESVVEEACDGQSGEEMGHYLLLEDDENFLLPSAVVGETSRTIEEDVVVQLPIQQTDMWAEGLQLFHSSPFDGIEKPLWMDEIPFMESESRHLKREILGTKNFVSSKKLSTREKAKAKRFARPIWKP